MSELLSRWRGKSTNQWVPLQASLELTYRCNERCSHCYIEKFADDQNRILKIEDWEKVLNELRNAGTLYLILMGGEAMLNPLFWDIAKLGSKKGFHVSMISNGLKIRDQEVANRLAEVGISQVTFSLYSLKPEIHDRMTRVPWSHMKTKAAIDYCLNSGLEVNANCLLTKENIYDVFALEDYCVERGLELKVDPNVTPKLNGDMQPTMQRASEDQLRWFFKERARRWPNSRPEAYHEPKEAYICNAAKGKCAVNPYGELLPCIEIRQSFGNLTEQSFNEIWFSEKAEKWRQPRIGDIKNPMAETPSSLCEHCPGMAKNEHGDAMKLTSYSKTIAKIKYEVSRNSL